MTLENSRIAVDVQMLTGQSKTHLSVWNESVSVHYQALAPLRALQMDAAKAGFDLQICSGFRSFQRQLLIWNEKLAGIRDVSDQSGLRLNLVDMTPWQQIQAVLRYSALPGASRHHWGSDVDVFDAAALPEGYRLQLNESEVNAGGIMAPMHDWLDQWLSRNPEFFRPYSGDIGGVAPERWHLSYRPVADRCAHLMQVGLLREVIANAKMLLREEVLDHMDEIFTRFIVL